MADRADINLKHLGEIERGRHDVHASTILKLARGLGLSYLDLAAATDEELAMLEEESRDS